MEKIYIFIFFSFEIKNLRYKVLIKKSPVIRKRKKNKE